MVGREGFEPSTYGIGMAGGEQVNAVSDQIELVSLKQGGGGG
jgi:hypothetical protein